MLDNFVHQNAENEISEIKNIVSDKLPKIDSSENRASKMTSHSKAIRGITKPSTVSNISKNSKGLPTSSYIPLLNSGQPFLNNHDSCFLNQDKVSESVIRSGGMFGMFVDSTTSDNRPIKANNYHFCNHVGFDDNKRPFVNEVGGGMFAIMVDHRNAPDKTIYSGHQRTEKNISQDFDEKKLMKIPKKTINSATIVHEHNQLEKNDSPLNHEEIPIRVQRSNFYTPIDTKSNDRYRSPIWTPDLALERYGGTKKLLFGVSEF